MTTQQGSGPISGAGIGLRNPHLDDMLSGAWPLNWLEILVDNYLGRPRQALWKLDSLRQDHPMTFHGVGMSLAGSEALDREYLQLLAQRMDDFEPQWISDHLCWTHHGQHYLHDLLPVPYTEEVVRHVAQRIRQVQDVLGQRILVENVSSYLQWQDSDMTEWEFVNRVAEEADCYLLLDVNNVYVSAWNQGFDARHYIDAVDMTRVREIHLAGFRAQENLLLDVHGEKVHAPVWELYAHTVKRAPQVPVLIEWDNDLPPLEVLLGEARKAAQVLAREAEDAA
ncbi:MAG TPA: DUF692 domain-containing protein [Gammaproteobacteria bacterium]|nr:DUF692 domain-containing protein [Gammaproteobacteria bacterium]